MNKSAKKLFLVKDLPVFIEARDEAEAMILFSVAMEAMETEGFGSLQEVPDDDVSYVQPETQKLDKKLLN